MKPIYKRKWFLIAVGVAAFMVIGIISNLGESEEPAPTPTATPAPTATPVPTATVVELNDDSVGLEVFRQTDWIPTDIAFERFCVQATQNLEV